MKIHLINDGVSQVDSKDYHKVKDYRWYRAGKGYALGYKGSDRLVKMHHLIIGKPDPGLVTDHINRDRLDNRRSNLRHVTQSVNALNGSRRLTNKSGVVGVCWSPDRNKWRAYAVVEGSQKHLGRYKTFREAVRARKRFNSEAGIP